MRRSEFAIAVVAVLVGIGTLTTVRAQSEKGAQESLRTTELAFAASVKERDREAFVSFLADEAVFVSGSTLRGSEAIAAAWAPFFEEQGPVLEWHPVDAEVLESEGLGMTRGPYTLTSRQPDGSTAVTRGTFFSIWRRQADGSWKILIDSGSLPEADGADP